MYVQTNKPNHQFSTMRKLAHHPRQNQQQPMPVVYVKLLTGHQFIQNLRRV